MKAGLKKIVMLALILSLSVNVPAVGHVKAASAKGVTVGEFSNMLEKATGQTGLVQEGEFQDTDMISRADAAVLANRAEELKNGETYDTDLYKQITDKKRISDLSKIDQAKKDAVVKVFLKGIMVGETNGMYSHSRTFYGGKSLTASQAKTIVSRVADKSKRLKISPDGQLIRTTKLPKNYKDYPYILAAFPNGFYEKGYHWPKDAISPVETRQSTLNGYPMKDVLAAYLDKWTGKVERNLKTRMNMNYKTVDNKWISTLANTYYVYDNGDSDDAAQNKRRTDDIKEYLSAAKKNKLVIKGLYSVEPSTLYDEGGYCMRSYVKFKVVSANNMKLHQEVMYGSKIYLDTLKKNRWYTMYIDIELGTCNGSSDGYDFAVSWDNFY